MDDKGKLASKWEVGMWLGRSTVTNEHLVGCASGVIKVRTIKRRPEEMQSDKLLMDGMIWLPWAVDHDPEVGKHTAWTPTPGCTACEEENAEQRRAGRPRKHNEECRMR